MIRRLTVLAIALMAGIASASFGSISAEANSPSYSFGGYAKGVIPHGINDAGVCAGVWMTKNASFAVKILPNGRMTKLAKEQSAAYDIANNGAIVGQIGHSARVWEANGTILAPISAIHNSAATAISPAGTLVVGNMTMMAPAGFPDNSAFKLIRRGEGNWVSGMIGTGGAHAVNDLGRVVGQTNEGTPQIFGYPTFDGQGVYLGVNNDGTVVGHIEKHPVIVWPDQIRTITNITGTYRDINDAGDVVGEEEGIPIVRYAGGHTVPMTSLVAPRVLRGWKLLTAKSINRAGDIVGTGTYKGKPRGYVFKNRTAIRLVTN